MLSATIDETDNKGCPIYDIQYSWFLDMAVKLQE